MREGVTVEAATARAKKLGDDIRDMLNTFQDETGLATGYISIDRHDGNGAQRVRDVRINVNLPNTDKLY